MEVPGLATGPVLWTVESCCRTCSWRVALRKFVVLTRTSNAAVDADPMVGPEMAGLRESDRGPGAWLPAGLFPPARGEALLPLAADEPVLLN
jgi:hypothetical protein